MCRPTRLPYRGRLKWLGELSEDLRPAATPGYWRQHVHKESARNTGSPKAWSAMTNRKPVKDRLGALGWRRGSPSLRLPEHPTVSHTECKKPLRHRLYPLFSAS